MFTLAPPYALGMRFFRGFPLLGVIRMMGEMRDLLQRMQVSLRLFGLSILMSMLSQFINVHVLVTVMDLSNGLIKGDFEFVRHHRLCAWIIGQWPVLFHSSASLFYLLLFLTFLTSLAKNVVSYASAMTMIRMMSLASRRMRQLLFNRYMSFGKLYFDHVGMARVNHVLMNFSGAMTQQIRLLHGTIGQVFMFLAYLWMMMMISVPLTIVVLSMTVFLLSISRLGLKRVEGVSDIIAEAQVATSQNIFNLLNCIPLVKSYAQEEDEKVRFSQLNNREARLQCQIARRKGLIHPVEELTTMTALMIVAATIAYLSGQSRLFRVGDVFVFFYLVRNSLPALNSITKYGSAVSAARGPLNALKDVLSDKGKPFVISGTHKFEGLKEKIEFRDLTFAYGDEPVLKRIKFDIVAGKTTAIVGKTGAGKSTLAHLILRFYDCESGKIFLDGKDIRDFTPKSLMSRIAFVGQDPQILNDTIMENLCYGLGRVPKGDELYSVLSAAGLEEFVKNLKDGLSTRLGDRGIRLSGGERQRLSIARALLKSADILILDEATSALDSKTEQEIQIALDRLMAGRTALVIAHRLSTIRNADHIVVLHRGRVAEEGRFDKLLLAQGKFSEFWRAQHPSQMFEPFLGQSLIPGAL